jgi:hypothetical protein
MQIKVLLKQETPGSPYQAFLVTILDNNQDVIRKVNTASEIGKTGQY